MKKVKGIFGIGILLLVINLIATRYDVRWDMTSQKLYTLSEPNKKILDNIENRVELTLLMGRDVPLSFKKLISETEFFLKSLSLENDNVWFDYFDLDAINDSQKNNLFELFANQGVNPYTIREKTSDGIKQKLLYPYIHVQSKSGERYINILESREPNQTEQDAIYESILSLESKVIKALHDLSKKNKSIVALFFMHMFG